MGGGHAGWQGEVREEEHAKPGGRSRTRPTKSGMLGSAGNNNHQHQTRIGDNNTPLPYLADGAPHRRKIEIVANIKVWPGHVEIWSVDGEFLCLLSMENQC